VGGFVLSSVAGGRGGGGGGGIAVSGIDSSHRKIHFIFLSILVAVLSRRCPLQIHDRRRGANEKDDRRSIDPIRQPIHDELCSEPASAGRDSRFKKFNCHIIHIQDVQ